MNITKMILDDLIMNHKARFVKFNQETASWMEVDSIVARDKVRHAIRFAIRRQEKQTLKEKRKQKARHIHYPLRYATLPLYDSSSDSEEVEIKNSNSRQCKALEIAAASSRIRTGNEDELGTTLQPLDNVEPPCNPWTSEDFNFLLRGTDLFEQKNEQGTPLEMPSSTKQETIVLGAAISDDTIVN